MSWIIRNAQGAICGRLMHKPPAGNKLPDGSPEAPEFCEDDPSQPGYDATKVQEVQAFVAAQAVPRPRIQSLEERVLIAKGLATKADFDAETSR